MAKVDKLEDRTIWFIREYKRLDELEKLPTNTVLARQLGIKSKSTISNILAGIQNIQPAQWDAFRKLYLKAENGSNNYEREKESMLEEAVRRERESADRERKALLEDKAFLQEMIRSNLTLALATLKTIGIRQEAEGETVLASLERIERKPEGSLIAAADTRRAQIEKEWQVHGNAIVESK